jgi:hypothetical protein
MNPTYEFLREMIGGLAPADQESHREISWCNAAHTVGLSRDSRGCIEVFVVCPELHPTIAVVRDCLEYQEWFTRDGARLEANRFVLPSGEHFDAVAALIGVELLAAGASTDPAHAFATTEPMLALALRRVALADEAVLGLIGELVFLEAMLKRVSVSSRQAVLDAWTGSVPATRDFQLGPVGVEVKTTTGATSSHFIHAVGQVELGASVHGAAETSLFLLSVGIRWLDDSSVGRNLPEIVEAIINLLDSPLAQEAFIDRTRQYGGDVLLGYNHPEDRNKVRFQRTFELRFERLYDLSDAAIHIIRAVTLDGLDHVGHDSVQFRIDLPSQVRGDLNPVAGIQRIITRILDVTSVEYQ